MMKSAIVGCGGIAAVHGAVLHQNPDAEAVAYADIKKERAEAFAQKYGGSAYGSLEEMLEQESIDVLHICTPHYLHVPMAIKALKKGIHVLMEKPPAISHEQLKELQEAAAGKRVGVCFQNRYNKDVQKALSLVRSGESGKILGARATVMWHRDAPYYTESGWRGAWATEGGGVLINQSIHTLDLLRYFLGNPTAVEGHVCNHHLKGVIEVEDTAEAYIQFGDVNALFYATTAYVSDSPVMVELVCENMTLKMEDGRLTCTPKGGESKTYTFETDNCLGKSYWGYGHQELIGDYYRCIRENRPFSVPAEDAAKTLELMLGIYESSKNGDVIAL